MRTLGRFLFLLFAVVTLSGHGVAQQLVYHAQEHHRADGHAMHAHDHGEGLTVPIATKSASDVSGEELCAVASCEAPDSDQSGADFHIPCCGSFVALPPAEFGVKALVFDVVDHPVGRSRLALGELRYPLLRPPRQLV